MARWAAWYANSGLGAGRKSINRWQFVGFPGAAGGESSGVADLLAIRRDHEHADSGVCRGDLFDILLLRIRYGASRWPTQDELRRLWAVQRLYSAKAVVLAEWKKGGAEPTFYVLSNVNVDGLGAWRKTAPLEVFTAPCREVRPTNAHACAECGNDHRISPPCATQLNPAGLV